MVIDPEITSVFFQWAKPYRGPAFVDIRFIQDREKRRVPLYVGVYLAPIDLWLSLFGQYPVFQQGQVFRLGLPLLHGCPHSRGPGLLRFEIRMLDDQEEGH